MLKAEAEAERRAQNKALPVKAKAADEAEKNETKPRDKQGKPKSGRYKRARAQENFTNPDSRVMKLSGGGFVLAGRTPCAARIGMGVTPAAK